MPYPATKRINAVTPATPERELQASLRFILPSNFAFQYLVFCLDV